MSSAPSQPTSDMIVVLPGMRLSPEGPLLRRHVRKEAERSADYLARYDRTTVLYDAVRLANGRVLMTAPRLLNLWSELKRHLIIGGTKPGFRRRIYPKFEFLETSAAGDTVECRLSDAEMRLPIREGQSEVFCGLRCVVTMNKNNDLAWIAAWARHYVENHGLEAVVIFDNGSTAYPPHAIADTLAAVEGLKAIRVVVADFPYGTVSSGRGWQIRPKFLQPAMMNLARRDFLSEAKAVLNIDIDEIIPRAEKTVFDAALNARFGVVRIPGIWAYPAPGSDMPCPHHVHLYGPEPPRKSNPKWCARPGGVLEMLTGWNVHNIGGEFFKRLPLHEEFRYLHCRGVSTGWKSHDRRYVFPDNLSFQPEFEAILPRPVDHA